MKKYENAVRDVVHLLFEKNYEEIISKSKIQRGNGIFIKNEIEDYPGELTFPKEIYFKDFDIINTENKNEAIIEFFLWFNNEKSELQIILLVEKDTGLYSFLDLLVP